MNINNYKPKNTDTDYALSKLDDLLKQAMREVQAKLDRAKAAKQLAGNVGHWDVQVRCRELEDSLRDLLGLIESGQLVRDTTRDHLPEYTMKALDVSMKISKAAGLLTDEEDESNREPSEV
jgi:hypothetical protein